MTYPSVTVGFVQKEKFNLSARTLGALYWNSDIPFNLIIVDCNIPPRYRNEIDRVLEGKTNYRIIETHKYLQPNQSRAIAIQEAQDDYICLLESDTFVPPNWLSKMMDACLEYDGNCLVVPELFEGHTTDLRIHMDPKLGSIRKWTGSDGEIHREVLPDRSVKMRYQDISCRPIPATEIHCYLTTRKVIDRIGLPDENLSTREHFDLSLALHDAEIPVILQGCVQANFYQAPPVYSDEMEFWKFIWDPNSAAETNAYLEQKWNVFPFPNSVPYVIEQRYRTNRVSWYLRRRYQRLQGKVQRIGRRLFGTGSNRA